MKCALGLFAIVINLILISANAAGAGCDNPPRLRFSLIPQGDAKRDATNLQPLLQALEAELGKPVDVILPTSYGYVIEGLLAGSIDLAMMGPASYAAAKNNDPEITAFASYGKKAGPFQPEGPYYRSVLIVRSDSSYQTRDALRGVRLALVDPASTSGAVLPRYLFTPLLKTPFEKFFGTVVYTGGHDKSIAAVANGRVDAAFVSTAMLSDLVGRGSARKEDYRVLWQSTPIPLDPFVYRGRLCAPIRDGIRKVFFLDHGERFRTLLEQMNAVRFAPVSDQEYQVIREIQRGAR